MTTVREWYRSRLRESNSERQSEGEAQGGGWSRHMTTQRQTQKHRHVSCHAAHMSRHFANFSKMVAHMSVLHAYELPLLFFFPNGCSHVGFSLI
jgi:hypothetical protein